MQKKTERAGKPEKKNNIFIDTKKKKHFVGKCFDFFLADEMRAQKESNDPSRPVYLIYFAQLFGFDFQIR